jgi:hypothetical protein
MLINERNDGLHFGEAGYEFLSQIIADKIKHIVDTKEGANIESSETHCFSSCNCLK